MPNNEQDPEMGTNGEHDPEAGRAGESGSQEDLAAEVERLRVALKAVNAEAAERRVKLKEFEEAEAKRREAELSELERAQRAAEQAQAERDELMEKLRSTQLTHAATMAAQTLNFHDPAAAIKLADLSQVQVESGSVEGVQKALEELAKANPWMLKTSQPASGDINAGSRGRTKSPSLDDIVAKKRATSGYSRF